MSEKQSLLETSPAAVDVPRRLREAREEAGLSLRELARHLEISASALSQIETGKSRPSVRTLYALVSQLNLSMDQLFDNPGKVKMDDTSLPAPDENQPKPAARPFGKTTGPPAARQMVQRAEDRRRLDLDSGVRWERLTSEQDQLVDFLQVTYQPGGASNSEGHLVRHAGREYGLVVSGRLDVTIGFETYRCEPGDSISFDSGEPHLLANNCPEPAIAIWFVVGRRGGDRQKSTFVD